MAGRNGAPLSTGERIFSRLARGIVRHPWYPILFWIVLLLVAAPFLSQLDSVTTNSATSLSSSSPSAIAQSEMDRLFPNASAGSASILLFTGPNITGPVGRASVLGATTAIVSDPSLKDVQSVSTVYTAYGGYLGGMAQLADGVIAGAQSASPPLLTATNASASLLWGPPALYVQTWSGLVAANPSTPPSQWNYPAYQQAEGALGSNATLQAILSAFYNGPGGTGGGFNATPSPCPSPLSLPSCADGVARGTLEPLLGQIAPGPSAGALFQAVLSNLGIENYTAAAAQRWTASTQLAPTAGLPASFVDLVWTRFPNGTATPAAVGAWAAAIASNWTPGTGPLPAPLSITTSFVDPSDTAQIVYVTFSQSDSASNGSSGNPIYSDVAEINRIVPPVLAQTDAGHSLTFYQTGPAALDLTQNQDLDSSLAIVLPLTILVLVVITMLYFRSPLAPAVTFGALGIAIGLGIGGIVLLGTLVQHVDSTTLTLEDTFVLGVGTDYSIFLLARYREELHRGRSSEEAIVTSVTWAGQSVATSGATAILSTLALAFSGVALLSQWGMVLSLAILLTVLIALTVVPALLVLIGPRVFWPRTGPRLDAEAKRMRQRWAEERTYFFRVGRFTQRRPKTVVAVVVAVSIPLLYLAAVAPISFDFYEQLPGGRPATDGLTSLNQHFGPGYAFPTSVLVTFASPLFQGGGTNGTEFTELSEVTGLLASTPGVASVQSPVGPYGAPLPLWLNYSTESVGVQEQLSGTLAGSLGSDGRTVVLQVTSNDSGLSLGAVNLLTTFEDRIGAYQAAHPAIVSVAYGGGASVTRDLQQQTSLATERMAIAVSIGLILVLLIVLRSWLIPLLAVVTIGVSIAWAWGVNDLVMRMIVGDPIFFFVPTILFILILGLGIDYNIFLLTRVREERLKGRPSGEAVVQAVASTGGIISAAAVILASAFAILLTGSFILLQVLGFAVATAIVLDAMVVRTYLVPSTLHLLGERVWRLFGSRGPPAAGPPDGPSRTR